jgi:hypothetical protein
MTDPVNETDFVDLATNLLTYYSFDLAGQPIDQRIEAWIQQYPPSWVKAAVVEALYQGRYKAVSVEHILTIWGRRGQPICHFNSEFERMVCDPISIGLHTFPSATATSTPATSTPAASGSIALETNAPQLAVPEGAEPRETLTREPSHQATPQPSQQLSASSSTSTIPPGSMDQVITPHIEKAEQLLHSDRPIQDASPHPSPSQKGEAATRLRPTDSPDPSLPPASNENPSTAYGVHPFPTYGHPPFKASKDNDIEFVGSLPPDSIHKFVPSPESSTFYLRLQAMASSEHALAALNQHHNSPDHSVTNGAPLPPDSGLPSDDPFSDVFEPRKSAPGDTDRTEGNTQKPPYSSHLENIHLPPQPDLEAIADALHKEALQEESARQGFSPLNSIRKTNASDSPHPPGSDSQ